LLKTFNLTPLSGWLYAVTHGAFYRHHDSTGMLSTYVIKNIKTTGSNDTFLGEALFKFGGNKLEG